MSWLVAELWPFLLLAMGLGAGLTVLSSTKRVKVERWVPTEVAPQEQTTVEEMISAATAQVPAARTATTVPTSPFPAYRGAGDHPRPWEEEELWSRPISHVGAKRATSEDEWEDAAENWRNWTTTPSGPGARPVTPGPTFGGKPSDAELFAEARSATPFDPDAEEEPEHDSFPYATPVGALTRHDDFAHDEPIDLGPIDRGPIDRGPVDSGPHDLATVVNLSGRHLRRPPYGPGSAHADPTRPDGPDGFTIKGHEASKLYHPTDSRFYSRTQADVWFEAEIAAEVAGFTRWDQRVPNDFEYRSGGQPDGRAAKA